MVRMLYLIGVLFLIPFQAHAVSISSLWHTDIGTVQSLHISSQNNLFYGTNTPAVNQLSNGQTVSTWASPTQLARFNQVSGIATDDAGNIYFTDSSANSLFYVDTRTGSISTITNQLNQPAGVALTVGGNIIVANMGSHQVLQITSSGNVSVIAGTGVAGYAGDNGLAVNAQLDLPAGIAVQSSAIYVSELGNHTVRRFTVGGAIETIVGTGVAGFLGDNGSASLAKLNQPSDIALDSAGRLYIADSGNNRVRRMNSIDHIITTIAGTGSAISSPFNQDALSTNIVNPTGIATDSLGNVYVSSSKQIIQITADNTASLGTPPTCIVPVTHPFSWIGFTLLGLLAYRFKGGRV